MTATQDATIAARLAALLHDSDIMTQSTGPDQLLAIPPSMTVTMIMHSDKEGTREIGLLLGRLAAGHKCGNPDCQKGNLT